MENNKLTLNNQINSFLFNYRNTPSTVTNKSPNALVFTYKTKTRLDTINPRPQVKFNSDREHPVVSNKKLFGCITPQDKPQVVFHKNHKVFYRNHFKNDVNWIPATFVKEVSRNVFMILVSGKCKTVHRNQITPSNLSDEYDNTKVLSPVPYVPHKKVVKFKPQEQCSGYTKKRRRSFTKAEVPKRSKRMKEQRKRNQV